VNIKDKIRTIPNWPIEGVMFRDIVPLMQDPQAFRETCDRFHERYKDQDIDKVVGIDARGFIFAGVLAYSLGVGLVPVRKQGKLPPETISEQYALEYGTATVEVARGAIAPGDKLLMLDDLLATGGTMMAATRLVTRLGGQIVECAFIVELPDLKGREKIKDYGVFALTEFEGE
jgi:adenine phosphoribosyltransferase